MNKQLKENIFKKEGIYKKESNGSFNLYIMGISKEEKVRHSNI
jgi:hypothetical protein